VIPGPWRVWLEVGGRGAAQWRSVTAAPGTGQRLAVSGDLMAADAMADGEASLEVADVIYGRESPDRARPSTWLAGTLARYPGCSVAAIAQAGGGCLAVPRGGRPLAFPFFMPNGPGFDPLAHAIFVYGWLTAGWPLAALEPPRLETAVSRGHPAGERMTGTVEPIPFRMYYEGPSSSSRRRIAPASGASTSEKTTNASVR
jgi:hypothetical protein